MTSFARLAPLAVLLLLACIPPQPVQAQWKCNLEDVSPGPGSTPASGSSLSGKMLAISATGLEGAIGPPTNWSTQNDGVTVDHVAAADKDGHLVLFYSYPESDWKAVNVMEKTQTAIASNVRPESWVFPDGQNVLERIAAPSPSGDLLLFTWHSGSDWTATNLTAITNKKIVGAVTSWQVPLGDRMVEHIGARGIDNHFLVFWRIAGGDWGLVDVSALTGGQQAGDSGTSWTQNSGSEWAEFVAMPDPTGDLILFTFKPSTNWQVQNISQMTAAKQKVGGAAVHWSAPAGLQTEYMAAPAPNGDLLLFYQDPLEHVWLVQNITAITAQGVNGSVANWNTQDGSVWWEHLAGRGNNDHLYVFYRPTGGSWQVKDVTGFTNRTITQTPTAWITAKGAYAGENLAAPSWDGHLHIFTFNLATDWRTKDVSLTAYGRIMYAASEMAGVWRSEDYGTTWEQSMRPQPNYGMQTTDGLEVPYILDLAASPVDPNLVLAATDNDNRNPSLTGVYRSTDAGKTWKLVHQVKCGQQVQRITQIMFAPDDPKRVYAAGGCALATSWDGGAKDAQRDTWDNVVPDGMTSQSRIWHLTASPALPGEIRRGYACGDGSFWRFSHSSVPGQNWLHTWKWLMDTSAATSLPQGFCGQTGTGMSDGAHVLAMEPGNPNHVYLANWTGQANGPSYYHPINGGPQGVHANIPVVYDTNNSGTFDSSKPIIWPPSFAPPQLANNVKLTHDPKLRFINKPPYNGHWDSGETIVYDANDAHKSTCQKQLPCQDQQVLSGDTPDVGVPFSDDPLIKFVDTGGLLGPRGAGEGSLWYGDYSTFNANNPVAAWENLPGPPLYYGGSTDSGDAFVFTQATRDNFLVFFSNRESVHVSVGKPVSGGWHRLGARDASESKRADDLKNLLYVHVDPHGLVVSPDFELTLVPSNQPPPYNGNMELQVPVPSTVAKLPVPDTCHGRIWLSNDGGIYRSDNCGRSWTPAQSGLSTLAAHNIAAVSQATRGQPTKPPALYFGTTDNDDFFTLDGGKTWRSAAGGCGDCDVWYADPAQAKRLWRHPDRDSGKEAFVLFLDGSGAPEPPSSRLTVNYPDPPNGSDRAMVGGEGGNDAYREGSRPIVQTLAAETPLTGGDYLAIEELRPPAPAAPYRVVIRAKDSVGLSASPWTQVGPQCNPSSTCSLPSSVSIVQASGGHAATVFYVGDENGLWRWPRRDSNSIEAWQQIVPGGGATRATRFFVNPYDSNDIYILDQDTVRHSTNGGGLWTPDAPLDWSLTDGGSFQRSCISDALCVLNDMIFDRNAPKTRFALGIAGVFYSSDGGLQWWRLLDTQALPGRPRAAFFDALTDPKDRSLYIALQGRGIMRCHPVPWQLP